MVDKMEIFLDAIIIDDLGWFIFEIDGYSQRHQVLGFPINRWQALLFGLYYLLITFSGNLTVHIPSKVIIDRLQPHFLWELIDEKSSGRQLTLIYNG